MNYLYIPTTTLNFNNIFSTESISPASFYENRGFGYRQFEDVAPSPFRNIILIYSKFPKFHIMDNERDNHPMVFRIDKNSLSPNSLQKLGEQEGISVYGYNQTIYFDPANVQLNFFSEEGMKIALSKSEPSLTTKMVKFYRRSFLIANPNNPDTFEWKTKFLDGIRDEYTEDYLKFLDTDLCINRLKGFAYAYVLGAFSSIPPPLAIHLGEIRALKSKASALLNDLSNRVDEKKRAETLSLFASLESNTSEIGKGAERFDPSQSDLIRISDFRLIQVKDKQLSDPRAADFIVRLINDYCLGCDFYADLSDDRMIVAMEGAKTIKTIIGNKWEGSPHKVYINALLNNVNSGCAFEIGSVDSLALKSFAAFILKGDDLEKLEEFLVANGIGDFRIAFAIWGAMFGFSKISKNYFSLLSECEDTGYAIDIYNHIKQQIQVNTIKSIDLIEPQVPTSDSSIKKATQWSSCLERLFKKYIGARKWKEKLESLLRDCSGVTENFIESLRKTTIPQLGGTTGTTKRDVIDFFKNELDENNIQIQSLELPKEKKIKLFYSDDFAWGAINHIVPKEHHNKVKKTLGWFQQEWDDPTSKYYAKYYEDRNKEGGDHEAIKAFCRVLRNGNDSNDFTIGKIAQTLLKKYNL